MKLDLHQTEIVSNLDLSDKIEFSIQSSAKVINLLTKNLYSEPWKSCVRELITNAIDANAAAGCADRPIEIDLKAPDALSLGAYLKISDCGNGMSPEMIRTTLATLGATTKDGDNLQHGGFGIGLLSLFAVTTQAQLDTCSNGICYRYLLMVDEVGVPCLKLVSKSPQARSGTTVTVPIPDSDRFDEVAAAVSWYSPFLEPKPISAPTGRFSGLESIERGDLTCFQGNGFCYYLDLQNPRYYCFTVVRIGQIVYELPCWNGINRRFTSDIWSDRHIGQILIVDIPIGTLDLPSSRESISDTPRNRTIVTQAIKNAIEGCRQLITDACEVERLVSMGFSELVDYLKNWGVPRIKWQGVEASLNYLSEEIYFLGLDDRYGNSGKRLKTYKRVRHGIVSNYLLHPERFFVYIGERDRMRSEIRKATGCNQKLEANEIHFLPPDPFANEIHIFSFESESQWLEWSASNSTMLALMPQVPIVRAKPRKKVTRTPLTPAQKIEKWVAKPKGLSVLYLDNYTEDCEWQQIAVPVDTFEPSIWMSSKWEETCKLGEYVKLLSLLGVKGVRVTIVEANVKELMELAASNDIQTFRGFVRLDTFVDSYAINYLEEMANIFERLRCLPFPCDYGESMYGCGKKARVYINILDTAIASPAAAKILGDRLTLAVELRDRLSVFGTIFSQTHRLKLRLANSFIAEMRSQGILPDPHLKSTFAYLFADLLDRFPVLKFLPCFTSTEWEDNVRSDSIESLMARFEDFAKLI